MKRGFYKMGNIIGQVYPLNFFLLYQRQKVKTMIEYLIVSNNILLVRIASCDIAYISSDGSYTTMKLINGEDYTFSFNLSSFERIIEQQLKDSAKMFIRVGRGLLINSTFIYAINLNRQELVLADTRTSAKYTLHVSKDALRGLKSLIEKTI